MNNTIYIATRDIKAGEIVTVGKNVDRYKKDNDLIPFVDAGWPNKDQSMKISNIKRIAIEKDIYAELHSNGYLFIHDERYDKSHIVSTNASSCEITPIKDNVYCCKHVAMGKFWYTNIYIEDHEVILSGTTKITNKKD